MKLSLLKLKHENKVIKFHKPLVQKILGVPLGTSPIMKLDTKSDDVEIRGMYSNECG